MGRTGLFVGRRATGDNLPQRSCPAARRRRSASGSPWSEGGVAHLVTGFLVVLPCCCPRQPASTYAVYALAGGMQSSSGSALSRAHHGRLTPWDMELHRCTRNDGSMQPRWYDDRLAVPTGAMPRLLVHLWAGGALDFMGMVSLHDHLVELRRAAGQAGAHVVARHSWASAAPRPLQLGLERTLTRLLPPPPGAAAGVCPGAPSSSAGLRGLATYRSVIRKLELTRHRWNFSCLEFS